MALGFKQLLAEDKLVRIFAVGRVVSPVLVDLVGLSEAYHGLWFDQEHGGLTYEQICWLCVAARANNLDTFVRMAPVDYSLVTQNLEAGAGGVMAARIESADHARKFMEWAKFHPQGMRGFNTSGWDARYTHIPPAKFAETANREHLTLIQIETQQALDEVDEIAAIPGVDLLFVGPSDLSQVLGRIGQFDDPELWAGIQKVADACKKNGIHWGTVPQGADFARRCVDMGCRMLSLGSDTSCIKKGIEGLQTAFGDLFD